MLAVLVLLGFGLLLSIVRYEYRKRSLGLPPGPAGLPLLGNMLQLPTTFMHRKLHSWTQEYGPLYTFWIGSKPFVVIGNVEVAADILDGMSGVTTRRPPMIKAREFYLRNRFVQVQDHNLLWRANRLAIHANLNVRATERFNQMQTQEAAYLTLGLLKHAAKPFHEHTHRFATSIIFRALYGGDGIGHLSTDPLKKVEELTLRLLHAGMPQNSVVDMFPVLKPLIENIKWLRRQADDWYEEADEEAERLYRAALNTDNWNASTVVHDLEANAEKYGLSSTDKSWLGLALYMAGQETTSTTLNIFALAMLHYPAVMRAAQHELQVVCGQHPPTFADRERLPYVQALVLETIRWGCPVGVGVMHMSSEDLEYNGYTIPKETVIMANLWSETRDQSVYPNADVFDPTRFLDASGNLLRSAQARHHGHVGFGHGRRVCPGKDFALNSLFVACAYMLWAFDFAWPVDARGEEVKCGVGETVDHGVVVAPRRFGVVLKGRQEGLEQKLGAVGGR